MAFKQTTKLNSNGISAIMGNPKLAKIVDKALNSPLGSTDREKAAGLLRTLNRAGGNPLIPQDGQGGKYDGQGGAGDLSVLQSSQQPNLSVGQSSQQPNLSVTQPTQQPSLSVGQPTLQPDISVAPTSIPGASQGSAAGISAIQPATKSGELQSSSGVVMFPAAPPLVSQGAPTGDIFDTRTVTGSSPAEIETLKTDTNIGVTDISNWYNGLSEIEQVRFKPLFDAVNSGIGEKTFAFKMLEDTESLRTLFPGVPDDALPTGASLTRQVEDIKENLREEFRLNELADKLQSLEITGSTIERDLEDYVIGRDKNISNLNGLIDKTKIIMSNSDPTNPYTQQRLQNYLNYLFISKGRHQKRYADFLESDIDRHEAKITRAQDTYNSALDRYEERLKTTTDIAEEDRKIFTDILEEMFTSVDEMEEESLKLGILRNNYYQELADTAQTTLDSSNGVSLTTTQKNNSRTNYINANPGKTLIDWESLNATDKLRWLTKKTSDEGDSDVQFYVDQIISQNQSFFDEDGIKWTSVPQAIRSKVNDRINELLEQLPEGDKKRSFLKRFFDPLGLILK